MLCGWVEGFWLSGLYLLLPLLCLWNEACSKAFCGVAVAFTAALCQKEGPWFTPHGPSCTAVKERVFLSAQ